MPLPLVTLSGRLEEAIPVTLSAQLEVHQEREEERERERERGGEKKGEGEIFNYSCSPPPYYRALSVVCFHPCDPTRFRGGGGGKTRKSTIETPAEPVEQEQQQDQDQDQEPEKGRREKEREGEEQEQEQAAASVYTRCSPLTEANSTGTGRPGPRRSLHIDSVLISTSHSSATLSSTTTTTSSHSRSSAACSE